MRRQRDFCRGCDHLAVVVGQALKRRLGGQSQPGMVAGEQLPQFLNRAQPDLGDGVLPGLLQLRRQVHRPQRWATGDQQVAGDFDVPAPGRLLRRGPAHLLVDVVIELIDGHVAVAVAVGVTGLQPAHQRLGEDRRPAPPGRQLSVLEGVLHGAGRGEDDAAAAFEPVPEVDGGVGPGQQPARERPAVAAVQQQHHPSRLAPGHLPVDELGRHGGRIQVAQLGVDGGEVQLAAVVRDAMAGEVQQEQIVARAVSEEGPDCAAQPPFRLVGGDLDLERADGRICQHSRQRLNVVSRSPKQSQSRIPVLVGRDDQRPTSTTHCPLTSLEEIRTLACHSACIHH
jgi:hypothetical protein